MKLRRATIEDYSDCKAIYDDFNNDMLYRGLSSNVEESTTAAKRNILEGIWDEPIFEEESKLTPERYQRFFDDSYGRSYVFEDDDGNLIGFITLFKISRFRWKLATIHVVDDYQTLEVLREIVDNLNEERHIVSMEVCAPLIEVRETLKEIGFRSLTRGGFMKKTRKT